MLTSDDTPKRSRYRAQLPSSPFERGLRLEHPCAQELLRRPLTKGVKAFISRGRRTGARLSNQEIIHAGFIFRDGKRTGRDGAAAARADPSGGRGGLPGPRIGGRGRGRPAARPARGPGVPGRRSGGQGQGRLARGRGQGSGQVARGLAGGRRAHPRDDARRLQCRAARRGALRRVDRRGGGRGAEEDRPRLRPVRDDPEARRLEPARQVGPRIVGGGGVVPVAAGVPRQARPQGLQGRRRDQYRRFLPGRGRADPPGHSPSRPIDGPEALPGRQRDS